MKLNLSTTQILLSLAVVYPKPLAQAQFRSPATLSPSDRYNQEREALLTQNTTQLKITVRLDREEYFPGEAAKVTIALQNSRSVPLEVFEPFLTETGAIDVQVKKVSNRGVSWSGLAPEPLCCSYGRRNTLPTQLFAAGLVLEKTYMSYEAHFNFSAAPLFNMPETPGEYRLVYTYAPHDPVPFRVVPARLVQSAHIPLAKADKYFSREQGKAVSLQREMRMAVLESGGIYYVVVGCQARTNDRQIYVDAGGNILSTTGIGPYTRIASSTIPIVSLEGTADEAENTKVSWATAAGRSTLKLDAARKPIRE